MRAWEILTRTPEVQYSSGGGVAKVTPLTGYSLIDAGDKAFPHSAAYPTKGKEQKRGSVLTLRPSNPKCLKLPRCLDN